MKQPQVPAFVLNAVAITAAVFVIAGCTTSRQRGIAYTAAYPLNGDEIYIGLASMECFGAGCIDYGLLIFEDGSVVCRLHDSDAIRKTFRKRLSPQTFLDLKAHLVRSDFFSRPDEESVLSHGRMASLSANFGKGHKIRQFAFGADTATKPGDWATVELIIQTTDVRGWTDINRRQRWARQGR